MECCPDHITVPEVITLNGFPVKTTHNPTLLADRELYGEYCTRKMEIDLDANLSHNREVLAYFHELTEAIININHLAISDEQEKQAIGISIYQILMQHEKFFCNKNRE
jgi:hypothetical protein